MKRPMVRVMDTSDALTALRALDLPSQRHRTLAAQIVAADDIERRRVLYRARAEVAAAQDAAQSDYEALRRSRADWACRNPVQSRTAPSASIVSTYGDRDGVIPQPRPVVVTWTTPKRPDVIRERVSQNLPESYADIARKQAAKLEAERAREPASEPDIVHGTSRAYRQAGCRCEECRDWKRKTRAPQVTRARAEVRAHGTVSMYSGGCRCALCRDAKRESMRDYRRKQSFRESA